MNYILLAIVVVLVFEIVRFRQQAREAELKRMQEAALREKIKDATAREELQDAKYQAYNHAFCLARRGRELIRAATIDIVVRRRHVDNDQSIDEPELRRDMAQILQAYEPVVASLEELSKKH